jgi:transcriptional regulator with XRE-family HTH domain
MQNGEALFRHELGLRLQQARAKARIDRGQLSLLTGFSENRIAQWERGTAQIYAEELYRLAEALETTPEWLLNWDRNRRN